MLGHAGTYCTGADTHSLNYATYKHQAFVINIAMAKVDDVFTGSKWI